MDGFVIVQPGAPRDFLHWTFRRTAGEAWRIHMQWHRRLDSGRYDESTLRQRWMNKGYRVARATLVVEPLTESPDSESKSDASTKSLD